MSAKIDQGVSTRRRRQGADNRFLFGGWLPCAWQEFYYGNASKIDACFKHYHHHHEGMPFPRFISPQTREAVILTQVASVSFSPFYFPSSPEYFNAIPIRNLRQPLHERFARRLFSPRNSAASAAANFGFVSFLT
jgi:hypothetical protein